MKNLFPVLLIVSAFISGCSTADFKVLRALSEGMSQPEALLTISMYGFTREKELFRPPEGWPKEETGFVSPGWRAGLIEKEIQKEVYLVEYYPVGHGLFGAGQLFLFYDSDEKLISFYRRQIN